MNRPTIAAKGVSKGGRVKHTRLRAHPRPHRLDYETRQRIRRGFLTNAEIMAKVWRDME